MLHSLQNSRSPSEGSSRLFADLAYPAPKVEIPMRPAPLDVVNQRHGTGTIHADSTGQAGPQREWSMRQETRPPEYTTRWSDLLIVRA
jgi:DNA polymerase V